MTTTHDPEMARLQQLEADGILRVLPTPIITVWANHADGGYSGISPANDREWLRTLEREGHAITTDSRHWGPTNHRIAGIGVGHDDARFAETGGREGSMAAYYENGDAFGGRWWEDTDRHFSTGVKYYGCTSTVR